MRSTKVHPQKSQFSVKNSRKIQKSPVFAKLAFILSLLESF